MYTIDEQLILQEAYSFNQNNEIKEKEENDNITVENLKMLDFGSFFHKHPSQISLGRISGDFSLSKELNEKRKNILDYIKNCLT